MPDSPLSPSPTNSHRRLPIPNRRLVPTLLPMSPSPLMPALSISPPGGPNSSLSTGLLFDDSIRRRSNPSFEMARAAHSLPSLDPRLKRAVSPLTLHAPELPPHQARSLPPPQHQEARLDSAIEFFASGSSGGESASIAPLFGSRVLEAVPMESENSGLNKTSFDSNRPAACDHNKSASKVDSSDSEPAVQHTQCYCCCWPAPPNSAPLERSSLRCFVVPPPPPLARADSYPPYVPSSFLATGASPLPLPTSLQRLFDSSLAGGPPPLEPWPNPLSSSTSPLQPPTTPLDHREPESTMSEQSSTPQKIVVSLPSSAASRGASTASRGQDRPASSTKGPEASQHDGQHTRRPPTFSIRGSASQTRGRVARQGPVTRSASGSTTLTPVAAAAAANDSVATSPSTAPSLSAGIYTSRWAADDTKPTSTPSPATPSRPSTRGGRGRGRGGRGRGGSITSSTTTGTPPRSGIATPKKETKPNDRENEAAQPPKNETLAMAASTSTESEAGESTPSKANDASSRDANESNTTTITSNDAASLSLSNLSIADDKDDPKTSAAKKEAVAKSSPAPRRIYPTRDRVTTGGVAKSRMTTEELDAKMARMRIENEKTQAQHDKLEAEKAEVEQQRKAEKAAKEEQHKAEVAKQERTKKLQSDIDATRARSAAMKMAAIQGRAWDQEKLKREGDNEPTAPSYPSEELGPLVRDHLGRMITAPAGPVIHHIGVKDDNAVWDRVEHYEDDSEEDEEEAKAVAAQLTGNIPTAQG
ncbi:BQ2448_5278 [Microbotryum intermedium]|uniref:BQ2448_5278 protein n=1 Tax=Microbotryum intermedium TaxID=269621 RepID=A0A238F3Q6_9BASI|nr:BQ2448_5278 [Microbotryum intermedium]